MTSVPTVLLDGERRNQTEVLYQFQQQICERAEEKVLNGSGELSGKMMLLRIVENNKIDSHSMAG